jgi:hypothetical protein
MPICFRLFAQDARRAASRARASAGKSIAASMPMIAMTTNNSINVNPRFLVLTVFSPIRAGVSLTSFWTSLQRSSSVLTPAC